MQLSIEVPPDRAFVPIEVEIVHKSFEKAAKEVRAAVERTLLSVRDFDYCSVNLHDYDPPRPSGDLWIAVGALRADIHLGGINDVSERMDRLDNCLRSWRTNASVRDRGKDKVLKPGTRLFLGEPVLVIDDPASHRETLLKSWATRLEAAASGVSAPQWHPTDLRCVASGIVRVTERSISALRLELEVQLEVLHPVREAPTVDQISCPPPV